MSEKKFVYYKDIKYSVNPRFSETDDLVSDYNRYVQECEKYKDVLFLEKDLRKLNKDWKSVFKNDNPLVLDIGCGHGYLFEYLAENNPQENFIGIDIKFKPLGITSEKILKKNLKNAKTGRYHVQIIDEIFAENSISKAYVFFPSPWVKKRHRKNRFFNPLFIENFIKVLKSGAVVHIKSDNLEYFEQMIDISETTGKFKINKITYDFWNSSFTDFLNGFKTMFESFAVRDKLKINYAELICEK